MPRTPPAAADAAPPPPADAVAIAAAMVMTKAAHEKSWQWCVHLDLMEQRIAASSPALWNGLEKKGVVVDNLAEKRPLQNSHFVTTTPLSSFQVPGRKLMPVSQSPLTLSRPNRAREAGTTIVGEIFSTTPGGLQPRGRRHERGSKREAKPYSYCYVQL